MQEPNARGICASLTDHEIMALGAPVNLADAHTHQTPTEKEWRAVHSRLPQLFREAQGMTQEESDLAAFRALLKTAGQYSVIENSWFLATYAASVSMDILAACASKRYSAGALIEPTFDNIPALLRKYNLALIPIDLHQLPACKVDPGRFLAMLSNMAPKPEFIFLVLPNNPTGHYFDKLGFEAVASFCATNDTALFIDATFRLYEPYLMFDMYEILNRSATSYVVIEDSGKLWPVADMKVSFMTASPDWHASLTAIKNDLLLNVSPFINLLVRDYSNFHTAHPEILHGLIADNRRRVRQTLARSKCLHSIFADSHVSVEFISTGQLHAYDLVDLLSQRGLAALPGEQFYWSDPASGAHAIRLALARDRSVINSAMEMLLEVLGRIS
jgi:aspartate/methionine/tyrosine aminotransferase